MGLFTWHNGDLPQNIKVTQVYGIVFSDDGKILLLVDDGKYKLAGGHPESYEKTFEETLKREFIEELNTELKDIHYLGYLLVDEPGKPKYAQVRMIAKIKKVGRIKPDPDNGKTYQRFLSNINLVKEHLQYQEEGNKMLDDAVTLAKTKYNLKIDNSPEYFV